MNKELAIKLLRGSVLGTNEQLHEAVFMAIKALKAEPIKHGKWIMKWHTFYRVELPYCSACNKGATFKWDYCPNCGARMDEVEE